MMERIEWRDIPGFDGRYKISTCGDIISFVYQPRLLAATLDRGGYRHVTLWHPGAKKGVPRKVHRLVAETFRGDEYFDGAHVRHLDANRLNNYVWNLRWGTPSENMQDRIRHGNNPSLKKTHCKRGHEFTPENTWIHPGVGARRCRTCKRDINRRFMRKYHAEKRDHAGGFVRCAAPAVTPQPETA